LEIRGGPGRGRELRGPGWGAELRRPGRGQFAKLASVGYHYSYSVINSTLFPVHSMNFRKSDPVMTSEAVLMQGWKLSFAEFFRFSSMKT
jgi:hypothetical protein